MKTTFTYFTTVIDSAEATRTEAFNVKVDIEYIFGSCRWMGNDILTKIC